MEHHSERARASDAKTTSRISSRACKNVKKSFGEPPRSKSRGETLDVDEQTAEGLRTEGQRRSRRQSSIERNLTIADKSRNSYQRHSSVAADAHVLRKIDTAAQQAAGAPRHRALISCCRGETHTHREEFRHLARRLHAGGWAPEKLNPRMQSLTAGPISAAALAGAALVVFGVPTITFTHAELEVLHNFVAKGGSMLVCIGERNNIDNSDTQQSTRSLSELLLPYGIAVQDDALISLVQQEKLKPREVLVHEGPLCSAAAAALLRDVTSGASSSSVPNGPGVVFPNSCSLVLAESTAAVADSNAAKQTAHSTTALMQLQRNLSNLVLNPRDDNCSASKQLPFQRAYSSHISCFLRPLSSNDLKSGLGVISGRAEALVTSGPMCNPPLRPLAAGWRSRSLAGGRVVALGSADALSGKWLERPANAAACDALLRWLQPEADENLGLLPIDSVPSAQLKQKSALHQASRPRVCLRIDTTLPGDWTTLLLDELLEI